MISPSIRLLYYYYLLGTRGCWRSKDYEACKAEYWVIDRIRIINDPALVVEEILRDLAEEAKWTTFQSTARKFQQ